MNDQELTAAVRESVGGVRMSIPEEQITSRGRAIRAARRRSMAVGATAVVSAGAAAIAAAVVLPGPASPAVQHAQDTAYVISHVTRALDAVPASTIFFMQSTNRAAVTDEWARGGNARIERMTPAGQPVSETGLAGTSTTVTTVVVNDQDKTWSRSDKSLGQVPAAAQANAARNAASPACDSRHGFTITDNASNMAASLRAWVSCGELKASGTASVDGVTDITLTTLVNGVTYTWYVNPATYLPARMTTTRPGVLLVQDDFQWLPPTSANLAKLNLPAAPQGFTQVAMPPSP